MMKKGFTLAEVLITLTIIGVVAVLTLPGLMSNTAEQQSRAALKKMLNTYSQAAEMNVPIAGYDYSGAKKSTASSYEDADKETRSLFHLFASRLDADRGQGIAFPTKTRSTLSTFADTAVYLRDGTAIYFDKTLASSPNKNDLLDDGRAKGIFVLFDTNGKKAPNAVSSCVSGAKSESWAGDDAGNCEKKEDRYIKDIFMMSLRDSSVSPLGAASTWMLDDTRYEAADINKSTAKASADSE